MPRRPAPGRPVPSATYRLQVRSSFGFPEVAEVADYLAALGVSHVYLSPVLAATPGSAHGYDIVDHTRINPELGGAEGFEAMASILREAGLGIVLDVVPNHMAVPVPEHGNLPLWSVLRDGPASEWARWFDVDWAVEGGRLLMPVLGQPLDEVLAAGEIVLAVDGGPSRGEAVVRYHDHEFPVRAGTEELRLTECLEAQHYRLAHWREAGERLNYRRFFDVTSLIAVRVEDPAVFDATHEVVVDLVRRGLVDGLRIDHPDGLADPAAYLASLADATHDAWVVVEKILEGDETLPPDWRCAGTTGYDALLRVGGVFVDPAGAAGLDATYRDLTGDRSTLAEVVDTAKRQVVEDILPAEVHRLARVAQRILPGADPDRLRPAIEALLVAMDRYRAYLTPGREAPADQLAVLAAAEARAVESAGRGLAEDVAVVARLAGGGHLPQTLVGSDDERREFVVRFQQTCGPVMAKGVEDTAFYRYPRLSSLNEVGGDPDHVGVAPEALVAFGEELGRQWPTTMTTLSTHDTKRSEDVRARLAVLSEDPAAWRAWVATARELTPGLASRDLDGPTEYLLWQTLVGTWPIDEPRLQVYAQKAVREAKLHTTWVDVDEAYEHAVSQFVSGTLGDEAVREHVASWCLATTDPWRANVLGQKLLQVVVPGVPDTYQGTEVVDLSLVDPDNRRPVDYRSRAARLALLDAGAQPADLSDAKLLVTSRALRLRRDHAEWFTGAGATFARAPASTEHALAVSRGDTGGERLVAVVTRLPVGLQREGGWGAHTVALPGGHWRDVLTGREVPPGECALADLLDSLPVALLVRT